MSVLGLTEDALYAQGYVAKIDEFEVIERRIETLARRRIRVFQEIMRRRERFAERLKDVVDAERESVIKSAAQRALGVS